jgi:hypothetical protein
MELYELREKNKGAGAAGMEETQAPTQTQAQKQRKKGRPSRLDVIEEEEEEEDEEEAEEEIAAVKAAKRKTYLPTQRQILINRTFIQDLYPEVDSLTPDQRDDGNTSTSQYTRRSARRQRRRLRGLGSIASF